MVPLPSPFLQPPGQLIARPNSGMLCAQPPSTFFPLTFALCEASATLTHSTIRSQPQVPRVMVQGGRLSVLKLVIGFLVSISGRNRGLDTVTVAVVNLKRSQDFLQLEEA